MTVVEVLQRTKQAIHPVLRILFGMARLRAASWVRTSKTSYSVTVFINQDGLGRSGSDINTNKGDFCHALPPIRLADSQALPYGVTRKKETSSRRST
jgi:hypothetical protein